MPCIDFTSIRSLLAVVLLCSLAKTAVAQSNLTPLFNPFSGQVTVQNTSGVLAAGTWVTIECSSTCPEPPAAQLALYINPGFSRKLSISVPALSGFQHFSHNVAFWSDLNFPTGIAVFTICSDAAGGLLESDERDNCIQVLRRQKAAKVNIPVPKPKLRLKH